MSNSWRFHMSMSMAHISMLNMSRIHSSKSVRGRWPILTSCIPSDWSAMPNGALIWLTTFIRLYVVKTDAKLIRYFRRGHFTNMVYPRTHAHTHTRTHARAYAGPHPQTQGRPHAYTHTHAQPSRASTLTIAHTHANGVGLE